MLFVQYRRSPSEQAQRTSTTETVAVTRTLYSDWDATGMRLDWSVGVVSSGKSNNNQDNNTLTVRAVSTLRTVDLESKRKALETIVGKIRWSQQG